MQKYTLKISETEYPYLYTLLGGLTHVLSSHSFSDIVVAELVDNQGSTVFSVSCPHGTCVDTPLSDFLEKHMMVSLGPLVSLQSINYELYSDELNYDNPYFYNLRFSCSITGKVTGLMDGDSFLPFWRDKTISDVFMELCEVPHALFILEFLTLCSRCFPDYLGPTAKAIDIDGFPC